jgi:hypothetical protein
LIQFVGGSRAAAIAGRRGRPRFRRGETQVQLSVVICGSE